MPFTRLQIGISAICDVAPWYALAFSTANAAILAVRIRAENDALTGVLMDRRKLTLVIKDDV